MKNDDDALPTSLPFCNEIEENLYLGSRDSAEDESIVRSLEVTHILTVDIFPVEPEWDLKVKFMYLRADDRPEEDLLTHFEDTNKFIDEGVKNGGCLVHCYFGVSRSATFVIAYIMQKYKLDFDEAFNRVKEGRSIVCPNPGFTYQLRLYYTMNWTLDRNNLQFRLYILEKLARTAKQAGSFSAVPEDLKLIWTTEDGDAEQLKCRKCRVPLFPQKNILPHMQDESIPWWDSRWQNLPEQLCTTSLFVEPVRWLLEQAQSLQGKVFCPKCGNKVGNYNWAGVYCECGACVQPGFHITPSKVDQTRSLSEPSSPVPQDSAQDSDSNS